jgi:Uma2 family endonuclease
VKEAPLTELEIQPDVQAAPYADLDRTPAERLSVVQPEDIPTLPMYRLSVAQYHAMLEAGILLSGDPIELLEGWLVLKMTKNPPHTATNRRTQRVLESILPTGWFITAQDPLTISPRNEPEPDILIVRGDSEEFAKRHPVPADVAVAMEISDSTLRTDRGVKLRIYARAGIPFYWLLNLVDGQLEVSSEPKDSTYQQTAIYTRDEMVALNLDGQEIARINVSELLPVD